jgi:hypothetical protein
MVRSNHRRSICVVDRKKQMLETYKPTKLNYPPMEILYGNTLEGLEGNYLPVPFHLFSCLTPLLGVSLAGIMSCLKNRIVPMRTNLFYFIFLYMDYYLLIM